MAEMNIPAAGLFHNCQMRARTRRPDIVIANLLLAGPRIVRKNHALPCFPGIYTEDRLHRHPDIERHTGKTRTKPHGIISELQIMSGRVTDIEDDLAVFDVLTRHADTFNGRIDDYVRRAAVITHPLVHGANQVRSL